MYLETAKNNKLFFVYIFFISFFVRAVFFYLFLGKNENYTTCDTAAYNNVALQILKGEGLTNLDGTSHFYRLPIYSIFLAVCYKLFGCDLKKALWLQLFLASFIPILVFFISIILFPKNFLLAKLTSIFSVFNLGLIIFSGFAMTESLFLMFFLLFLILFLPQFELFFCSFRLFKSDYKKMFLAGIFLGLASLTRPIGHYLIFLSILFLIFSKSAALS